MNYGPYAPVLIFAVVSVLFAGVGMLLSSLLRPSKMEPLKETTYECGEVPIGDTRIQFHFQYYMFALIFVIADVLTVFLALWAYSFSTMSLYAKFLMLVFVGLLTIGILYALKKEEILWI
ncbi:MAG: NADH-quinone oxidoreductase subunit A [Thermoplasmata archaeon]|uniref:NADH-quinone oxidoreductase subunit A n=1 Tax=Candidatus Sysuiplasma superficiale TaxID=2823368 RepID=A0A8J8CAH9_9ARCH|nr:NADH-quinone oxidoreductase subunit A [Candidatus Sysuiplasma superficiale]MBX8643814.1 NADH-quinone oxidoreductase subunit A [Candidatus Sysuiplasma superficiale]